MTKKNVLMSNNRLKHSLNKNNIKNKIMYFNLGKKLKAIVFKRKLVPSKLKLEI